MDATDLLRRAADGDQRAWHHLVRAYGGLLRAVAARHRMAADDAEDAAQTTWMELVQNVDSLRDPDRVGGWLATTMRRNCLRILRRYRREQPTADWETYDQTDQTTSLDERILAAERDRLLWQAVESLPGRQGQLLKVLFANADVSYEDVARRMSIAVGTVGPARQRALRRLAQLLSEGERSGAGSMRLMAVGFTTR